DAKNFAYKGIAVRLDNGPGGVSRGRYWMVYDADTLRVAGAWSGDRFIDYNGIMFNGRHNIHPRVAGDVHFQNRTGPGWSGPDEQGFVDPRFRGRDERPYGPLPRKWAHYKGLYHHGERAVISYTVGDANVLESPGLQTVGDVAAFTRTFNIGPRTRPLTLQVAQHPLGDQATLHHNGAIVLGAGEPQLTQPKQPVVKLNGKTFLQVDDGDRFNLHSADFTIAAKINTRADGSIFCQTANESKWRPDGKSLFIRGGRLVFDIGWVGAVNGKRKVNDGKPHDVAMTWKHETGEVSFYVDGKLDARGSLRPKQPQRNQVVRLGFTAANFPATPYFRGQLAEVRFYQRALAADELAADELAANEHKPIGHWRVSGTTGEAAPNLAAKEGVAKVVRGGAASTVSGATLLAGLSRQPRGAEWTNDGGSLRLKIPAGQAPLRFTVWTARADESESESLRRGLVFSAQSDDLRGFIKGGPPRWPQEIVTKPQLGSAGGPFEVDVLTHPAPNPWLARVRLTGLDFYEGGREMAVCTWDGDVWRVSGLDQMEKGLTWKRIASGLFQPLGLLVIDGQIHVTCRDQLCILRDLNGDGETDYYENLNNDHQVTEHFHEFAMGLQRDADGNFYYAKSARHALPALVPHHGTLLRITKDGSRTDILATGFRAANGVCLNPDGTFIVTDQEGHWNPKNRINWVHEGGFYGNMFGYHDVTDSSDQAMEQPLCWITNSFDRSPSELLWVDGKGWGPLEGSLLNLSYGYGKVYVVPHENRNGQMQGGMCELPIDRFPTGVMRGRFHPRDGQLYACGMFAWAGNQQKPGGLYRIRYTGRPVHLPTSLEATPAGMRVHFSGELNPDSVKPDRFAVKTWSLKRTANYGSKHYDERPLKISGVELAADRRSVLVRIPDIKPTWCMEIKYAVESAEGSPVRGVIHNTIHTVKQ
ncbi:MAG: heme-binding protein, partial [Pirellulaceae bacterium]|nr:heme-binding protein [Pirellulaceae bacterium]